jgi:hypothetical protein
MSQLRFADDRRRCQILEPDTIKNVLAGGKVLQQATLDPAGSARLDNDGNRGGVLISNCKKVLSLQREIIYSLGRHKTLLMCCGPQKTLGRRK